MNTSNKSGPNPSEFVPPWEDYPPIGISVVVVIVDTRTRTRVFQARRVQSYAATPESLAALPSRLNSMVRGAGEDAQQELNKFLKLLAEPEPPTPPTAEQPNTPTPEADYLMPTPLPLLSDPPGAGLSGPP